jgi:hypothetical protein
MALKLPNPLNLQDIEDVDAQIAIQYYEGDFISRRCQFEGSEVIVETEIDPGEIYPRTFIHLITKELRPGMDDREYDVERTKRIPWCRLVIENSTDSEVTQFDFDHGRAKGIRTYLWVRAYNYAVVLQKKKERRGTDGNNKKTTQLITAYLLDEKGLETIERRYSQRIKNEHRPSTN